MWLITPIGFFSVVQKPNTDYLTVRSRVEDDLRLLRARYLPNLSDSVSTPNNDYGYRAFCSHEDFGEAMKKISQDIDYGNFKSHIKRVQGKSRAGVYSDVWTSLYALKYLDVYEELGYSQNEEA